MDPDCVFCGIVAGSEPASEVYRDDRVTAFLSIGPVTPQPGPGRAELDANASTIRGALASPGNEDDGR